MKGSSPANILVLWVYWVSRQAGAVEEYVIVDQPLPSEVAGQAAQARLKGHFPLLSLFRLGKGGAILQFPDVAAVTASSMRSMSGTLKTRYVQENDMPNQFEVQKPSNEIESQAEAARLAYSRPTVETLDVGSTHTKLSPATPETVLTGS